MIVRKANVVGMRLLAVGLFVGGMVLMSVPSVSVGLILAATVIACTTVVIETGGWMGLGPIGAGCMRAHPMSLPEWTFPFV